MPHAAVATRCRHRSRQAVPDRLRRGSDEEGTDWREVAGLVLSFDTTNEPEPAKRIWESHLARARWMPKNERRHHGEAAP